MPLNLDLSDQIPEDNTTPVFDPLMNSSYTKHLLMATEGDGIRITYETDKQAIAERHRFYEHIKKLKARGVMAVEQLSISLKGPVLTMAIVKPISVEKL